MFMQKSKSKVCSNIQVRKKAKLEEKKTCNQNNCEQCVSSLKGSLPVSCVQHHVSCWGPEIYKHPFLNKVAYFSWVLTSSSLRKIFYATFSEHNTGSWMDLIIVRGNKSHSGNSTSLISKEFFVEKGRNDTFKEGSNMEFRVQSDNTAQKVGISVEAHTKFSLTKLAHVLRSMTWLAHTVLGPETPDFHFFLFGEIKTLQVSQAEGEFHSNQNPRGHFFRGVMTGVIALHAKASGGSLPTGGLTPDPKARLQCGTKFKDF